MTPGPGSASTHHNDNLFFSYTIAVIFDRDVKGNRAQKMFTSNTEKHHISQILYPVHIKLFIYCVLI